MSYSPQGAGSSGSGGSAGVLDLWSSFSASILVGGTVGNKALPTLTMANIPDGVTITRAIILAKYNYISNSSLNLNRIVGAGQAIQIQKAVGGSWLTGITIPTVILSVTSSNIIGGDVWIGDADIKAQIPANGANVSFQWLNAKSDYDYLTFASIQTGIRLWYKA